MKLEPVYLVAPASQPRSMPTRRAFLLAGCAAVGGAAVGVAGGFAIGSGMDRPASEPPPGDTPTVTDPRLLRLHELVNNSSDSELIDQYAQLVAGFFSGPSDPVLIRGAIRLARLCPTVTDPGKQRVLARSLLQLRTYPGVAEALAPYIASLQRVAR